MAKRMGTADTGWRGAPTVPVDGLDATVVAALDALVDLAIELSRGVCGGIRLPAAIGRAPGVQVEVRVGRNVAAQLTAASASQLQQVAVEAVAGAIRRSHGSMVVIDISTDADSIVLRIQDDGASVPAAAAHEPLALDEIATLKRGDLRVRPPRPGGIAVELRLPLLIAGRVPPGLAARRPSAVEGAEVAPPAAVEPGDRTPGPRHRRTHN